MSVHTQALGAATGGWGDSRASSEAASPMARAENQLYFPVLQIILSLHSLRLLRRIIIHYHYALLINYAARRSVPAALLQRRPS
jgi:hypothetical protein